MAQNITRRIKENIMAAMDEVLPNRHHENKEVQSAVDDDKGSRR